MSNNNSKGKRFFLNESEGDEEQVFAVGFVGCGQELNDKFIDGCQKNIRREKPNIFR